MTATTTNIGTQQEQRAVSRIRRLALTAGWLMAAICARWGSFVDAGQLGPDPEREIGRHTGARI